MKGRRVAIVVNLITESGVWGKLVDRAGRVVLTARKLTGVNNGLPDLMVRESSSAMLHQRNASF